MSILSAASEKTQAMEMGLELQERARLCWPHVNGTGHQHLSQGQPNVPAPEPGGSGQPNQPIATAQHNLPPIAAITSCRPSSSLALKGQSPYPAVALSPKERNRLHISTPPQISTSSSSPSPKAPSSTPKSDIPCPSPSPPSSRDKKEEHIFTQPNPPRLIQPAARAPTPFPDHPPSSSLIHPPPLRLEPRPPKSQNSDFSVPVATPSTFSLPIKSAFAAVQRVSLDRASSFERPSSVDTFQDTVAPMPAAAAAAAVDVNPKPYSPNRQEQEIRPPSSESTPISVPSPKHTDETSPNSANNTTPCTGNITTMVPPSSSSLNLRMDNSSKLTVTSPQSTSITTTNHLLSNPISTANDTNNPTGSYPNNNANALSITPVSNVQCFSSQSEHFVASTTENALTLTQSNSGSNFSTQTATTSHTQKNPQSHVPFSTSDGLRNYSNQSHRYFASPSYADNVRPLSSPQSLKREPLPATTTHNPIITQHDTYLAHQSAESFRSLVHSHSPHTNLAANETVPNTVGLPIEHSRHSVQVTQSRVAQIPGSQNEGYRSTGGRGQHTSGDSYIERQSPQTYSGLNEHFRNVGGASPRNASVHSDITSRLNLRSAPVGSAALPAHSSSPMSAFNASSVNRSVYPTQPLSSPRSFHSPGDNRPPFQPEFKPQSNKDYTHVPRHFTTQHERGVIHPHPAATSESFRSFAPNIEPSEASRGPQQQGARSGYTYPTGVSLDSSRIHLPYSATPGSFSQQSPGHASSRSLNSQGDKLHPSHSGYMTGPSDLHRGFAQQSEKGDISYPTATGLTSRNSPAYVHRSSIPSMPAAPTSRMNLTPDKSKFQGASIYGYPSSTVSSVTVTPIGQKGHEPQQPYSNPVSHHGGTEPYPAFSKAPQKTALPPCSYPPTSRPSSSPQVAQYHRSDTTRQTWNVPVSSSRPQESSNVLMTGAPIHHTPDKMQTPHLPHNTSQVHRSTTTYQPPTGHQSSPSAFTSRDRQRNYPATNALARINPSPVVSVSSHYPPPYPSPSHTKQGSASYYSSSRIPSSHHSESPQHSQPIPYNGRQSSSTVSSTFSSGLPRINFPSPAAASFSGPTTSSTSSSFRGNGPPSSQQSYSRSTPMSDTAKLTSTSRHHGLPVGQLHQGSRSIHETFGQHGRQQAVGEAAYRHSTSPYTPARSYPMETDTCRNPFELPTPSNHTLTTGSSSVIKSTNPAASYTYKTSESKSGNVIPYPCETLHRSSFQPHSGSASHSRFPAEQRTSDARDERQKPQQLSARFPPVPQSNYDLQRQIYDRMTGVQQTPPRLIEKSRTEEKVAPANRAEPLPRQKRESPLDLSVKTVRQSADSTRDDVDLYMSKHLNQKPRLASAPKIDFNPNFAGPLVQPEIRNAIALPPVQSIRKFQQPPTTEVTQPQHLKRPINDYDAHIPPKIPKVDAWKVAMDEQIEERLKAARQSRHPAAPLTPLHPPAQSVTPTNPELLQPPSKPLRNQTSPQQKHERGPHMVGSELSRSRGWSSGVYQPPSRIEPDPERLVQQISQGVMPDTRLLQDRNVVDILRSSLEEKEAQLQALQAAARRRQPLPPFDALPVERMCVPPSYPHGHPRGAEPVPIGVEPTRKYLKGASSQGDLDGLAAFLAARIRTKAEMKQMGPSMDSPDVQVGRSTTTSGISPPKLMREIRAPQTQPSRRQILSPGSEETTTVGILKTRDPAGLRSSSETSVFDFRESDSESEMPVLERQTLEGLRRPRKTQPCSASSASVDPQPGPAPKEIEPDPAWDNACDMFVHQLQTKPIKRSVRKKKPNPKFFASELENPSFLKIKSEPAVGEDNKPAEEEANNKPKNSQKIKEETDLVLHGASDEEMPPLPVLPKEESSSDDDDLAGVTIIKDGRVKLVTRKQKVVPSDSEWGSSEVESSSGDESASSSSESESENDSEGSTVWRGRRKTRTHDDSDSNEEAVVKTRQGRRTRSRVVSESEAGSDVSETRTKPRRSRKALASESDYSDHSDVKVSGRRTRSNPVNESGPRTRTRATSEENDRGKKKKTTRVQTRQQAKSVHPPGRMKLRSKKRGVAKGSAFRPGWEDDLIKFKQQLRMPDRLISVAKPKKRQGPSSLPDLDDDDDDDDDDVNRGEKSNNPKTLKKVKKEKKDLDEKEDSSKSSARTKQNKGKGLKEKGKKEKGEKSNGDRPSSAPPLSRRSGLGMVTRGKGKLLQRSGLRASVGMRRSNKAVQNSKRHLNKGKKRLKLRRKFRSGFDYMRRKKKQAQRKEPTPSISETKRRERSDIMDISAELKTWVVNKSAGETVLHRAARLGYTDVAAYCLDSLRLPPSPRDHAGYTPLHEACSRGHIGVARYLLQYGANVSESARGGVRPLHQAAENNHIELVRLLLAYGADPLLATYTGQTALTLTTLDEVRNLIQQHLADIQGNEASKWSFDGPAVVFDPTWAVNPLADPPTPGGSYNEVEIEASKAMLPPLFRLTTVDDPSDRWLLLPDLMTCTHSPSAEALLARLPNTIRKDMSDDDFREQAKACNIFGVSNPPGKRVQLLRYDDAVRKLLEIEVVTISLTDH